MDLVLDTFIPTDHGLELNNIPASALAHPKTAQADSSGSISSPKTKTNQ